MSSLAKICSRHSSASPANQKLCKVLFYHSLQHGFVTIPKRPECLPFFIIIDLFLWNDEMGNKVVCLCIEGVKTYERAAYKTMICTGVNFPALPQNKRASVTLELSIE